ncbi:hypothetical protein KVR01_011506 [Diaporthe batatas]|uniref:uncharacterized protein n=1 Tax=Diaporthe batatas TaxID=748121 RepID=UPI001D03A679|nr:uncharacterized protein KVR01_011506 [Diaporthe batatas]KAG8158384.1 hypothetical protein KVR01_011506 [Diaporthe batatas]
MDRLSHPPHAVADLSRFNFTLAQEDIDALNALLKRPLPIATWENSSQPDERFGISRDWLSNTISQWQNYEWAKYQERINSVPNFKLAVEDDGEEYNVHFAALFSAREDATPLILMHGWPGSFLEFMPLLLKLQAAHASDPASLPYHIVVPSLPGYGFTAVGTSKNMQTPDAARILHKLMLKLGFGAPGYIAQGGDFGSALAIHMFKGFDECIGAHVNMLFLTPPKEEGVAPPTEQELVTLKRVEDFRATGSAYALIQGTKPSTVGLAVASSPQGLLSWIGEKMVLWSHATPSMQDILDNVSLYWFTGCYPSSIWGYRELVNADIEKISNFWGLGDHKKPFGYSYFPFEITCVPKSWCDATGRVTFYRAHDKGGHFAALELPDVLWKDIVEFVDHVKASE